MGSRTEEFFEWARSINKLDYYEAILETSIDYAGDQKRRLEASDLLMKMDKEFVKYIENK